MEQIQAIQMIGTQRSGSNLLRVMLNGIEGISAPHPPHILQRFLPLLNKYGDLKEENNFLKLSEDICEMVRLNPVSWGDVLLDPEELVYQSSSYSLYGLFQGVYDSAARQTNKTMWLCKSMKNVHFAREMERSGIHPYYIYLYRDGRDVALSFKKAIVGEKHIYSIAKSWKADQEAALRLRQICRPEFFFALSYEELTSKPQETMQRLCRFLNVPYTSRIMEFYKTPESYLTAQGGEMWENVTQSIIRGNTCKFLRELSAEEISIFESVAGDTLLKLGYPLYSLPELRKSLLPEEVLRYENENMILKQSFLQTASVADIEKRRPQDELIKRIRAYV